MNKYETAAHERPGAIVPPLCVDFGRCLKIIFFDASLGRPKIVPTQLAAPRGPQYTLMHWFGCISLPGRGQLPKNLYIKSEISYDRSTAPMGRCPCDV